MDFLIKNGTIYDPAQHKTWKGDIALVDGKIAAPSENHSYRQVIDAEGCIVTTGLIDYHVHYMRGASEGGVQADVVSFCSGRKGGSNIAAAVCNALMYQVTRA